MTKAGESILRGAREALAFVRGEKVDAIVHIPQSVDVKAIRRRLGMSQTRFAATFGFPVATVRSWEQGRRQPELSARAFLTVLNREPEAVRRALTS
jgi:putative transcriptional regulator